MRRRGALVGTIAILAVALTTGTGATATADPPPLDSVVLTAKQAGPGYTRFTMDGGRQVNGQVTLDFCGGGYPSEALRLRRFQTIYANPAGGAQLSNEVVRYAPGGARQALREVARRVRTCPRTPVQSPVPGHGAERYLSVALIHDPGLLAGSVAINMTVEVTENGRKVRREIIADLPATRKLPLRRLCLGRHRSVEARECAARCPRKRRQPAAQRSADGLIAVRPLTTTR